MEHRTSSAAPCTRPGEDSPEVHPCYTLKAIDHRNPTNGAPGWWGVRCPRCRAWLTRYDFTAEDSLSIARGALSSGSHICGTKAGS